MFRRIGLYLTPQTLHLRNPRIAYVLARDPISPRSPPSWTPSSPLGGIARGKSSRQPARVARTRGPPETRNAARDGSETRPAREGASSTHTPRTSRESRCFGIWEGPHITNLPSSARAG